MAYYVAEGAVIKGNITIGEDSGIWYNATIRGDSNQIAIGSRTNVQDNAVVHVSSGYPVSSGDDVTIGHGAIVHVLRKEWGKFILLILLGATMHKSLLVVIPLYFLASRCWKKWQLVLAALFCSTFFFLQDFYLKLVVFLYPTYEDTEYLEGGTSMINILRCAAVLVLALLCYKKCVKENIRNRFYFYCNLGALAMYVCCSFLPIISRIGYYLTITHIFFLPALVNGIENEKLRKLCRAGVILAGIVYFAVFIMMKAGENGLRILPYQTFLFHEMVPILSDVT